MKKSLEDKLNPKKGQERVLTMQEAMEYLADRGIPCKSRATFYRLIEDFNIPYILVNPKGKTKIRRFKPSDLRKIMRF